ncbi:hypothetical protein [Endozoicomonas sp. ONNA1]|uniref:hypothetical protein n=1 Tax=Endozoicomonas sp. ONNA1 TaxID=2828740 RepID=UPI002148DCA8|nr:hypothetical protein [Endozoicomonas sp. ONNA1]
MKTIFFGVVLVIATAGFCSEENDSICVDNRFFFQINDPYDYEVNIKFLDESSNLLYEYDLFNELNPDAITKKILIDFSSQVITLTSILLDGSRKVIEREKETEKDDKIESLLPSNYLITVTHASNHDVASISNQCHSSNDQEKVRILQVYTNTFLKQSSTFKSSTEFYGITEIDESKKEQLFNEKLHFLGYKKDACGRYIPINSTSPGSTDCIRIVVPLFLDYLPKKLPLK